MTVDCVVDASVGIKLFLDEALSDRAYALFAHLADVPPARFYVPDHFFIECANILWKYSRNYGYPQTAARQDISDLVHLPWRIVSTADLAEASLQLAVVRDVTAYDAAYVVLAQQLSLPLVTADETLVRRLAGDDLDVRLLADWPLLGTT